MVSLSALVVRSPVTKESEIVKIEIFIGINFFKLFNFFTSYGDWDAINKVKTFEISKSFSLFDLSISRIMTDNVGATADETVNIITLSKNF